MTASPPKGRFIPASEAVPPISSIDRDLQSAVLGRLERDATVPAAQVGVLVQGGRVTLCGVVDTLVQRRAAARAAAAVPGVTVVKDELLVYLSPTLVHVDSMMAAVADALTDDPNVPTAAISVLATVDGTVVLTGSVESGAERTAASRAIEQLRNVRVLKNRLVLKPVAASPVTGGAIRD